MEQILNKKTVEFILPFISIVAFLQAICIVNRVYCRTKKNYKQIQQTISALIQQITGSEVESFVDRIQNYGDVYAANFLSHIIQFEDKLTKYLATEKVHTMTIESPVKQCNNCFKGKNSPNWFIYNAPPCGKDATLYTNNNIGKLTQINKYIRKKL